MPDADLSRVRLLRVVVLASGTATMALQMCAVRLLAPWVGASIVVWSTIIGLSLLAMSVGYAAGGRLADRSMDGRALARTLTLAAVLVAAVPAVAPALLPHVTLGAQGARADLVGSAIGFGALFLAPAILLGVTPPYAIRLALARVDDAGRTAGRLYALSTVGSILGTLLAALVLVQWVGTRVTLGGIAILLLVGADAARRVRGLAGPDATDAAVVRAPELAAGSDAAVVGIRFATVVVLVEGAALMTTELAIARLVAPFFGTSQAVWAVIIATVMGSIALGSRIGGRLADRL
ncbi:MAG: spermine synthase, partial [Thermoleophilia bacterium]|nr:spermine synthase [Thermoleophilia bacterium]